MKGSFGLKHVVSLILVLAVILFLLMLLGQVDTLKDALIDFFRNFK